VSRAICAAEAASLREAEAYTSASNDLWRSQAANGLAACCSVTCIPSRSGTAPNWQFHGHPQGGRRGKAPWWKKHLNPAASKSAPRIAAVPT